MPGANWTVPTTYDPADPRQPLKRRDPELARSEVAAREARDLAERPQAEEPEEEQE
jgi:hypothetical protein